jgi:hypothetical protein
LIEEQRMRKRREFTKEQLPEFDYTPEELERLERLKIAWGKLRPVGYEEEIVDEED